MTHQHQLLAAIFDCRLHGQFDDVGLSIYRNNLRATAIQALKITFPTVRSLIGEELFHPLAMYLLEHEATTSGNWASWGQLMPEALDSIDVLAQYPFLPDCAHLDFVCHQLIRRADYQVNFASLRLLEAEPAHHVRLCLNPTLTLIKSNYPIAEIRAAHQLNEIEQKAALTRVRELAQQQDAFYMACFLDGYHVRVSSLDKAEFTWLTELEACTLEEALCSLPSGALSFQDWLVNSVQSNLLYEVRKI